MPRNAGASRWRGSCFFLEIRWSWIMVSEIYTFYGHLSEIDVKAGDSLETGAVLGKSGPRDALRGPISTGG